MSKPAEIRGDPPSGEIATGMTAAKRPRDPRLDFFRGGAMFIILLAHTPGNTWTLWIPARFGFSDATEIFVFCSGMASAIAFGSIFQKRGWWLGAARIAHRVWQVYWAHIGVFLVTATMLYAIDHFDIGFRDRPYIHEPYVVPLFAQTGEALIGLLTLTYVPGLFDILPMYLVILGMIPVVMLCHRCGGMAGFLGFVAITWAAAQFAGYARIAPEIAEPNALQAASVAFGERLSFLNFPANPWSDGVWFFNPFGWQLVFFSGFGFGMGWLRPPPVLRWLVILCAAYLLLVVPFAWFKLHQGFYLPADWALTLWIAETRQWLEPLWWKSWIGPARYLHFIALAYLAWSAVGPKGIRLAEGFPTPAPPPGWLIASAALIGVATLPYTYIDEIKWLSPALDAWLLATLPLAPADRIGLLQIAHLAALVVLIWAAIGPHWRAWATTDAITRAVPVIRKVGTQSLAVFMVSIVLARFNGWVMDWMEQPGVWGARDVWVRLLVNSWGFGVLIFTAYLVSWIKSQPWRAKSENAVLSEDAGIRSLSEVAHPPSAGDPPRTRPIVAISR